MPNPLRRRTLLSLLLLLPGSLALGQAASAPKAAEPPCPAIDPPAASFRFAFVDPATGLPRQPTLEEATALAAANRAARLQALSALEVVVHPDGTKEIDLKDAFSIELIASRQKDDSLSIRCVPKGSALSSRTSPPPPRAAEEQ